MRIPVSVLVLVLEVTGLVRTEEGGAFSHIVMTVWNGTGPVPLAISSSSSVYPPGRRVSWILVTCGIWMRELHV